MDNKTMMLQSLKAASLFLDGAEKILNMRGGEGFAAAHPDLVGAFMLTAALDMHARIHVELHGELVESLRLLAGEP